MMGTCRNVCNDINNADTTCEKMMRRGVDLDQRGVYEGVGEVKGEGVRV